MFYGTNQESANGESSGGEGSTNGNGSAAVDFPEIKKKVGFVINKGSDSK